MQNEESRNVYYLCEECRIVKVSFYGDVCDSCSAPPEHEDDSLCADNMKIKYSS